MSRRTSASADGVRRQIEAIQAGTRDAAGFLGNIVAGVRRIREQQTFVSQAVEQHSLAAGEMHGSLAGVAEAGREIAGTTGEAARAVRETSVLAAETEQSAQSLDGMAKALQKLVTRG